MKNQQRKCALAKSNALSITERKVFNQSITKKLIPYLGNVNAIYLPYGSEVDITAVMENSRQSFAVPKTYPDHCMRFFSYEHTMPLEKSRFGVWEPIGGNEITEFDVIVVPLVAFDEECHRLGHGQGFYDRYVKDFRGRVIGVGYECQKLEHVACEEHDQLLDMVISETSVYIKN